MNVELQKINKIKKQMTNWTDIGHAGELIVSTDLILNNFIPFTSQLPTSPVDLIALKNSTTYRIQVKTGEFGDKGYFELNNLHKYRRDELDVIAAVDIKTKQIAYIKWTEINNRTKVRLYSKRRDGFIYFFDHIKFPE